MSGRVEAGTLPAEGAEGIAAEYRGESGIETFVPSDTDPVIVPCDCSM